MEMKLKREAKSKGLGKERANAYVYGTLRKSGWTPHKESKNHQKKVNGKMYDKEYC